MVSLRDSINLYIAKYLVASIHIFRLLSNYSIKPSITVAMKFRNVSYNAHDTSESFL